MKIIALVFSALVLSVPVYAQEREDKPSEIAQLIQCQAVDISLVHLHTQIAASLTALSGPVGIKKLQSLIDSYKALAATDKHRFDDLSKVAKEALIPDLLGRGIPMEAIKQKLIEALSKSVEDIQETMDSPQMTYADLTTAEKALMDESGRCEAFGVKEMKNHTF